MFKKFLAAIILTIILTTLIPQSPGHGVIAPIATTHAQDVYVDVNAYRELMQKFTNLTRRYKTFCSNVWYGKMGGRENMMVYQNQTCGKLNFYWVDYTVTPAMLKVCASNPLTVNGTITADTVTFGPNVDGTLPFKGANWQAEMLRHERYPCQIVEDLREIGDFDIIWKLAFAELETPITPENLGKVGLNQDGSIAVALAFTSATVLTFEPGEITPEEFWNQLGTNVEYVPGLEAMLAAEPQMNFPGTPVENTATGPIELDLDFGAALPMVAGILLLLLVVCGFVVARQ